MEPTPERIKELMDRHGYQEEAEIWYHLREARNRFAKMYRDDAEQADAGESGGMPKFTSGLFLQINVYPHVNALAQLLERRVLARDYPEGWGPRPAPEEEQPE